ncbi:MAG: DUF2975 domain-containing protein [Clostridium sp.]|nr:DUF2975 domain-containing protein [Clostridium sp.]
MWNNRRSVLLSQFCVMLFSAALLAVVVFANSLVKWLIGFSQAELHGTETYFFSTIYSGSLPAALLLYSLFRLLRHISARQMFLPENVDLLRRISWSCFAGSAVCFISTLYYFPWLLVAIPAGFMGLIVRVIKNVVALGVELQREADYTV